MNMVKPRTASVVVCPDCGSTEVRIHNSHRALQGVVQSWRHYVRHRYYRCARCGRSFQRVTEIREREAE